MHGHFVYPVELVGLVHGGDRARPGARLGGLGVVALAVAKIQVVEPDQLRFRTEHRARVLERHAQQMLRCREARILRVHGRGGDAADAQAAGGAVRGARERMRFVRQMTALAGRFGGD